MYISIEVNINYKKNSKENPEVQYTIVNSLIFAIDRLTQNLAQNNADPKYDTSRISVYLLEASLRVSNILGSSVQQEYISMPHRHLHPSSPVNRIHGNVEKERSYNSIDHNRSARELFCNRPKHNRVGISGKYANLHHKDD